MCYVDFVHVTQLHISSNKKVINKIEIIQNKKLLSLIDTQHTHNPDKVIFNFSNHVLSKSEKDLLIKGLNFAIPPKKLKFCNYLLLFLDK